MTLPLPINASLREQLHAHLDVHPPGPLREQLLRRHRQQRLRRRAAPVLALTIVTSLILIVAPYGPTTVDETEWQRRSAALEAAWRENSDPAWLLEDARAQDLMSHLRDVDDALARSYASNGNAASERAMLWRERSETLTALIDTRHRGGIAVQL
jgi:hypothetical protein